MVRAAQELGLPNPATKMDKFSAYYDLLQQANQKQNLTALQSEQQVVTKHFIDSLTCSLLLNRQELRAIDIGSGAGFPGIPLKLMFPEVRLDLLEAERRKQEFLNQAIHTLELANSQAVWGRAETLAHQIGYRASYDLAVMRAVTSLSQSAELAMGFVMTGGHLVVMKGPGLEDEMADGSFAIAQLGGTVKEVLHLELPFGAGRRSLVLVHKKRATPGQFPRSAAAISKRPLRAAT